MFSRELFESLIAEFLRVSRDKNKKRKTVEDNKKKQKSKNTLH